MNQDDVIKKLMEIASKPLKEPVKKFTEMSSTFSFINDAKVKSSPDIFIPFSVIFHRYYYWCKNNNIKPKNPNVFAKDLTKKFKSKQSSNVKVYFVNPEGFDLSDINLQEAVNLLQEVKDGKKGKKKKS